jgi:hypothetical protein
MAVVSEKYSVHVVASLDGRQFCNVSESDLQGLGRKQVTLAFASTKSRLDLLDGMARVRNAIDRVITEIEKEGV